MEEKRETILNPKTTVVSSMTRWNWLDTYGRYIQYGVYGIGVAGLVVMLRSLRLGTRFTDAKLIPKEFYEKNFNLFGHVQNISTVIVRPAGTLEETHVFLVQHDPIMMAIRRGLNRPYQNTKDPQSQLLRVTLPGLCIHPRYVDEVDRALKNQIVQFTLIRYDETYNSAMCLLYKKGIPFYRNFGAWCIRKGYGTLGAVENKEFKSSKFSKYYNELAREEEDANRNESRIVRRFYDAVKNLLTPKKKR